MDLIRKKLTGLILGHYEDQKRRTTTLDKEIHLEVEARFHLKTKDDYYRILDELDPERELTPVTLETFSYSNNQRKRVIHTPGVERPEVELIKKIRLFDDSQEQKHSQFKIVISSEEKLTENNNSEVNTDRYTKSYRYTKIIKDQNIRIDVSNTTVVFDKNSRGSNDSNEYMLEIEYINNKEDNYNRVSLEKSFERFIDNCLHYDRVVNNSIEFVPNKIKEYVISNFNLYLAQLRNKSANDKFDRYRLPRPTDINLGNLTNYNNILKDGPCAFTHKADGETRELMICKFGIFVLSGENNVNYVSNKTLKPFVNNDTITIMVGEWNPTLHEDSGKKHPIFIPFDILVDRNKKVYFLNLEKRIELYSAYTKIFNASGDTFSIEFIDKPFHIFNNIDDQYLIASKMLEEIKRKPGKKRTIPYFTDGIIIMPVDKPYARNTKIKKWKWDLTIDLKFSQNALMVNNESKDEIFASLKYLVSKEHKSRKTTFSDEQLDLISSKVAENEIWEFAFRDNEIIPYRPRIDKEFPNSNYVAQTLWDLINNPIKESTFRGEDNVLLRRHHNDIKKLLFDVIPNGSVGLDIGSGRGGDLHKWLSKDFEMFLVEPNDENIKEARKRIATSQKSLKHTLVQTGGENTEEILNMLNGRKVDFVSMMLSSSFFFKDSDILDKLINTIDLSLKDGGRLLMLTINGELLIEGMKGSKKLVTPYFEIEKKGNNMVEFHIKDSIVTKQTEWLVDITELAIRLEEKGIFLEYSKDLGRTEPLSLNIKDPYVSEKYTVDQKRNIYEYCDEYHKYSSINKLNAQTYLPKHQRIINDMYSALVFRKGKFECKNITQNKYSKYNYKSDSSVDQLSNIMKDKLIIDETKLPEIENVSIQEPEEENNIPEEPIDLEDIVF